MAELKNLAARDWQEGKVNRDWVGLAAGNYEMTAGYRWNNANWVMCIRFDLPAPAKSVTLSFCNYSGTSEDQNLRYKLTQSEDESLINADSNITGDGDFTLKHGDWVRNTVTIQRNLAAGTHYLYIWTNDSSKLYNVMRIRWVNTGDYNFIGTYEELEGYLPIKDSVGVRPYHVYVKTANGPVLLMPYIKTADGPKLLS